LARVVDIGCAVAGGSFASAVVLRPDGVIVDFASKGIGFERRTLPVIGAQDGILGTVLHRREPVRCRVEDDPWMVGLPRQHGPVHVLAVPLVIADTLTGALLVTRAAGEGTGREMFDDDEEQDLALFASHAALVLDNARLRAEARARGPALSAVKEVSDALLDGRPTVDVLLLVARSARSLLGAALTTVATVEPSGSVVVRVADGPRSELVRGRRHSTVESAAGDVMRTRRPLVVPDVASDERRHPQVEGIEGFGPAVVVPMVVGDMVFGTFAAMHETGTKTFTGEDLLVMQAFAAEAAIALEHERVRVELGRLALLEERERIAMELHDGVVQALFVVGLSLQAAETVVDDAGQMRTRLGQAIDSIDRAIRDLRNYIFGLSPAELADRHLERALRQVTENVARSGCIAASIDLDPRAASKLASRSATIIQAAREAMSNAMRHSGGELVTLRFVLEGDSVLLEVTDDGRGFDVVGRSAGGHGLGNLRSRAEDLGGTLEIASAVGHGTSVRIRVPIEA